MSNPTTLSRTDYYKVPFSEIMLDSENAREDLGDIAMLAESIYSAGIKNPVKGYKKDGKFFIVDGKRRYYACKYILEHIDAEINIIVPFVPEERGTSETDRILNRIILNEGKPYTPLELSTEIAKLKNLNIPQKVIAQKTGFTEIYISNLIKLNKAPQPVKDLIINGTVKSTAVMQWSGEWDEFIEKIEDIQKESIERNEEKVPSKKITGGQLKLNSFSVFKTYTKNIDINKMPKEKLLFYDFMLKMTKNELLISDFEDFFETKLLDESESTNEF